MLSSPLTAMPNMVMSSAWEYVWLPSTSDVTGQALTWFFQYPHVSPQTLVVGGAMTIVHWLVAVLLPVLPDESVTTAVNVKLPAIVGVPEISPVEAFNVKPGGRLPTIENM